jgi:hypothetical protein
MRNQRGLKLASGKGKKGRNGRGPRLGYEMKFPRPGNPIFSRFSPFEPKKEPRRNLGGVGKLRGVSYGRPDEIKTRFSTSFFPFLYTHVYI